VIAWTGCGGGDDDDPLAGRTADPDEVRKAMTALQAKGVEFGAVDRKGNPGEARLGQASVQDADLVHLKPLIHLKLVDMSGLANITDAGMGNLSDLPLLENLSLKGTGVSDAGLGRLSELKRLKTLNLSDTRVSDSGMPQLAKLEKLNELNLEKCSGVTDAGLNSLVPFESLKTLYIAETQVTDAGEQEFSKKRRDLNINR